MRRFLLTFVSVLVVAASAVPAAADTAAPVPQHVITCGWEQNYGTPYRSGTAVRGFVQVRCSDQLDDANTMAQLQIFDPSWRDYGNGEVSHSTGYYSGSSNKYIIHVNDGAGIKAGGWRYRTQGTHFGQHGNMFALPTYYSPIRYLYASG